MPWNPKLITCEGDKITEGAMELCLSNREDSLVYYQHKVQERIKAYDFQGAFDSLARVNLMVDQFSILAQPIEMDTLFREFFTNVSVQFFNEGIRFINAKDKKLVQFNGGPKVNYDIIRNDSLCNYFMNYSRNTQPQLSRPVTKMVLATPQYNIQHNMLCPAIWQNGLHG